MDAKEKVIWELRGTRQTRLLEYLDILGQLSTPMEHHGRNADGEHQIITDMGMMAEVEEREFTRQVGDIGVRSVAVGVVHEDLVSLTVNHPISMFRKGEVSLLRTWKGVYWKNGIFGKSVVIIPHDGRGRVFMVFAYRGPVICRWEIEFPGGGKKDAKTYEEAVNLQMLEEAGYEFTGAPVALEHEKNDFFIVDPSTNGTPIKTYAVRIGRQISPRPQEGEIISGGVFLDLVGALALYRRGWMQHPTRPDLQCHVSDGRNGHCFMQAQAHGLLL